MAAPTSYSAVHICTMLWEKNDFKKSSSQNLQTETDDFKDWAKSSLNASAGRIIIPTVKGNGSEDYLLEKLQKFYDTRPKVTGGKELVILVYSGHGAGGIGPETAGKLGYKPHDTTDKKRTYRRRLWYDANPDDKGDFLPGTGAFLDWGWIMTQLKVLPKMDHWIIYNCCFAGTALFPGPFTKDNEIHALPLKEAVLHSFVAVGPALKAKTGKTSFLKMVLEAAKKEQAGNGFTVNAVWKGLNKLSGFQTMIGLSDKFQKMTDDELMDWFEQPFDKMDATETEELKDEVKVWRLPYYGTVLNGLVDKTLIGADDANKGAGKQSKTASKTKMVPSSAASKSDRYVSLFDANGC